MDQELIEYLDRRFNQFREELLVDLGDEIRGAIAASAAETRGTLQQEIAASAAETRDTLRREIAASAAETRDTLRQEIAASAAEIREEMAATAAETRRHFDVVTEGSMTKIQLVAEGVIGVDQKVDRLAGEMRSEFQKVDRRFLHLQARVIDRD
ncbi:MAG TPA: hypothetical protein VK548_06910 [Candidatus Acidoferrum sp.]|nr:hypothetical protein [Candidatus Acidoferrum sp.]